MKFTQILLISQLLVTLRRCITLRLPTTSLNKAKFFNKFEYVQQFLPFRILLDEVRK
jgi:hypothetical protein